MNSKMSATRMRRLMAAAFVSTALVGFAGVGVARAADQAPQQVVDTIDGTLLHNMQNAKQLGFAGRYKAILPVVEHDFDVRHMTQTAVGSNWASLTPDQQNQLTDAFAKYIAANYADKFDGYSGEKFVQTGTRPLGSSTVVATQLVKSDGSPVALDYVTVQQNGQSQVVDVFYTGTISEMATHRSEFSSVYRQSGYNGLLNMLQTKVAQLGGQSSVS